VIPTEHHDTRRVSIMAKVRLLFVRHGPRSDDGDDRAAPLTPAGKSWAEELGAKLKALGIEPRVVLTSDYKHARETADILAGKGGVNVIAVPALTPRTAEGNFTIDNIIQTAAAGGADLETVGEVVVVGHENRLSQLITMMTGLRLRPLDLLDVVRVEADSLLELRLGTGKIPWRLPVRAYGEADLRPKVTSKMTVATFLAGFTFTALIQILMNVRGTPTEETLFGEPTLSAWLAAVAIFCLTAAVARFVVAAYSYDRLNMPVGFWGLERAPERVDLSADQGHQKAAHGLIYWHMIHIWRRVFTPAVCFAAAGFLLTVASKTSVWLSLGCLVLVLAAVLYYRRIRPQLGVD
jgi:phosphohistidine phosphatase SixA